MTALSPQRFMTRGEPLPRLILASYGTLGESLGKGSTGAVFELKRATPRPATARPPPCTLVVKRCHQQRKHGEEEEEGPVGAAPDSLVLDGAFVNELAFLSALRHRNVLPLLSVLTVDACEIGLVLPRALGSCAKLGLGPVLTPKDFATQLLTGLAYAARGLY
jgi:hypothetical protein